MDHIIFLEDEEILDNELLGIYSEAVELTKEEIVKLHAHLGEDTE